MYNFTSPTVKERVYRDSCGWRKKLFGLHAKNVLVITCRSSSSDRRAFLTKTPAFPAERANQKAFVILVPMFPLWEYLRSSQVHKNAAALLSLCGCMCEHVCGRVAELWLSFQESCNVFLKP